VVVNSPVEATVNGNAADVLNKIGWPILNELSVDPVEPFWRPDCKSTLWR
jgi:hypothetical protein